MSDCLVSISCFTYNHEPYIRQCLDGFVMQQTNFRFEAIVHDDASTDGTADIIREYAEKYPDIIKPIFETENQYSKHDGSLGRIMNEACTGKYIAMCEGDDYWTDPLKLQKQVDFLEEHEEYSMCFHKVVIESEMPEEWQKHFFDHIEERTYTARDIYDNWCVPTCSVLYRKDRLHYKQNKNIVFGDIYTWLLLAETGKLYCLPFAGGVYRRHQGSASCAYDVQTSVKLFWQYKFFEKRFPELKDISRRKQEDQGLKCIIYAPYFDGIWKYRFRYMFRHPKLFFSSFFTGTLLQYTKFRHH
ncbi:MAG: glycosyltransferase [Bacteroidales bacterium]|nr:glycosyltransferase [Bacteroidales bacterium]